MKRNEPSVDESMSDFCRRMIAESPDCVVAWYLMASYLYYHEDFSLLSDGLYDRLCRKILKRWKFIKHPHKRLLDRGSLRAGTGYAIRKRNYPSMCVSAAMRLMDMSIPAYHSKLQKQQGRAR